MADNLLFRQIPEFQKLFIRDQVPVFSINDRDHLLRTLDGLLIFSQPLFCPFSLGDVRHHAHNPQHPAMFVEVRATRPLDPNHATVGTYHAIANAKVRLLRTQLGDCSVQSCPVLGGIIVDSS